MRRPEQGPGRAEDVTFPPDDVRALLGETVAPFYDIVTGVLSELDGTCYEFMDIGEFEKLLHAPHPGKANRVYWLEILYRAHWAASVSLIRTHRWITAALRSRADQNLMAFAACSRGLLESAGDTYDSLGNVPLTIAENSQAVRAALGGHARTVHMVAGEIEDALIHFSYARKYASGDPFPQSHKTKNVADYLAHLVKVEPKIQPLYKALCDIVHSGASSAHVYLRQRTDGTYALTRRQEAQLLELLVQEFSQVMPAVLTCALNPGLLILRVLNALPERKLHTPSVARLSFIQIPVGKEIEAHLQSLRTPATHSPGGPRLH